MADDINNPSNQQFPERRPEPKDPSELVANVYSKQIAPMMDVTANLERAAGQAKAAGPSFSPTGEYNPGDPEAQAALAEQHLGTAMGALQVHPSAAANKMIELEHYTSRPGLSAIDPKFSGTGFDAQVKGREMEVPQSFHYLKGTTPEEQTALGRSPYKYSSSVPAEHIYDLSKDEHGIVNQAIQDNQGIINMSEIQKAVRDAGYKGSMVSAHPEASLSKTVTMFEPTAVTHINNQPITQAASKPSEGGPHLGSRIAQAYEDMPHNPNDPAVKSAYDALINETQAQYQQIKNTGIKIEPMPPGAPNPYPNGSKDLFADMDANKHIWYYPTEQGFGSSGSKVSDHPLMQPTTEMMNGKPMLANDMFRVVHDVFGHIKTGASFGPRGEENAWVEHMKMFSPEAQKALTTETRGQNSWVNYGPHGEANRANPANTKYAEQKAGLLPDWAMQPNAEQPPAPKAPKQPPVSIAPKPNDLGMYSKLENIVENKMGGSASPQQIMGMLREVKPDELEHAGISNFLEGKSKVSKQELLDHIRENNLDVREIEKGDYSDKSGTQTKFSEYTLPGGDNYREKLFQLPSNLQKALKIKQNEHREFDVVNPEGRTLFTTTDVADAQQYIKEEGLSPRNLIDYRSSHWGEPNVLAHTRVNDRIDSEGKKLLHIEEIQSDWHQAGREQGYGTKEVPTGLYLVRDAEGDVRAGGLRRKEDAESIARVIKGSKVEEKMETIQGVPDAPLKKTWHEFALKRLIKEAAEKGYDRLSWTPGAEQAERYSLATAVGEIEHYKNPDGTYNVKVSDPSRREIWRSENADPNELQGVIGKELTQKIVDAPPPKGFGYPNVLSGLDLKVGGEGMKGFYDKMIPEYLSKLGKKYGAKIGETEIPTETTRANRGPKSEAKFPSKRKVPYLEITPELRKAVLKEGLPMFAAGGQVGSNMKQNYVDGGEVASAPEADQQQLISQEPVQAEQQPMQAQMVNVIDPDTQEVGSVPAHQLEDVLSQGYTQATPEQVDAHFNKQYATPSQQLLAGVESAASAATFGLSTGLETAAGVSPEGIRGRKEANPITSAVGGIGGLAATAMIPGVGAARLLSQAGRGAAAAVGMEAAGGSLIQQMGREAVKGAFETVLFQGGEEVSKAFSKDPNQSAETAMTDLGLAAVLGGGLGVVIGAGMKGFEKLSTSKSGAPGFISELDKAAFDAGDFRATIENSPLLKEEQKLGIMSGLSKEKPEAAEIREAGKRLGANVMEGMVSDSPYVQKAEDSLINGQVPTYSGMKRAALYQEGYGKAEAAVESALGDPSRYSKAELGAVLKDSIVAQIEEQNAPIAALYNELKQFHDVIPLSEKSAPAIARNIGLIQELKLSPSSPEGALAKRVMGEIGNLKTVDDVKAYKAILGRSVSPTASSGEKRMAAILRDKLTDLEENSIERFAKNQMKTPEAKARIMGLIEQRKVANAQYKEFIEKVKTLSEQLGKGRVYGVQDALNFIREKLTPEEITSRLFSKKDSEFNAFFRKNFPEQVPLMQEYQKGALRADASKTGTLQPKLIFNQVNKLEPEIQKGIFSAAELQKLKDAETYIRAIPKNFNPSGTSGMSAFRAFFEHPAGAAMANIRDLGIEKFITKMGASPEVNQAVHLAKATVRGEKLLKNSVSAIFKAEKTELPVSLAPSDKKREKLDKLVLDLNKNPSKLLDLGKNNPVPEYNQQFAQVTSKAIEYLNSMRPNLDPKNPLDSKATASAFEKAKYNRALDLAQQPLLVLDHIKKGTLLPSDVAAINAMYPNLYNKMSAQLQEQVILAVNKGQTVPYRTRQMLSTFLGKPLDSTMTPEGIMGAQPTQQPEAPQQAPSKTKTGTALNKLSSRYQTPDESRLARKNKP